MFMAGFLTDVANIGEAPQNLMGRGGGLIQNIEGA